MADAGTNRSARHLRKGISRTDAQRWHSLCPRRCSEGLVLLGLYPSMHCGVCRVFRPVRTERPAGSHNYPDRTPAGLFFPVAICGTVPASAVYGNSGIADRPSDRTGGASSATVFLRRRREKLETPSNSGFDDPLGRSCPRYVHTSGWLRPVESGDGRVERRTDSNTISEGPYGTTAARGARFSSQAMSQLP